MEWFEYLIMVAAILLVILPIYLKVRAYKKHKPTCGCGKDFSSCNLCKLDFDKIRREIKESSCKN